MSSSSRSAESRLLTSDSLLGAIADGRAAAVADMVAEARAADTWPVSSAACLFAAVKLRQAATVSQLLDAGAPAQFLVSQLPPSDLASLSGAGISADGVGDMSPLVIAVRQQNLEVARLLLQAGAQVEAAGMPLLLQLNDALLADARSSSGGDSGGRAGGGGFLPPPLPLPAWDPPTSSIAGNARQTAPVSSSCSSQDLSFDGMDFILDLDTAAASDTGASGPSVTARLTAAASNLHLLWLLMWHGADPLETSPTNPSLCFLTACRNPVLLRLAVNYVRHECEHGRQLSDYDAKLLMAGAVRAYLSGF